jgi:hypothetical protein
MPHPLEIIEQRDNLELHMKRLTELHQLDLSIANAMARHLREIPFESRQQVHIRADIDLGRAEIQEKLQHLGDASETRDAIEKVLLKHLSLYQCNNSSSCL